MTDRKKPGTPEDRLKIDNPDWEEAVKKAMGTERPKDGWPEVENPRRVKRGPNRKKK